MGLCTSGGVCQPQFVMRVSMARLFLAIRLSPSKAAAKISDGSGSQKKPLPRVQGKRVQGRFSLRSRWRTARLSFASKIDPPATSALAPAAMSAGEFFSSTPPSTSIQSSCPRSSHSRLSWSIFRRPMSRYLGPPWPGLTSLKSWTRGRVLQSASQYSSPQPHWVRVQSQGRVRPASRTEGHHTRRA